VIDRARWAERKLQYEFSDTSLLERALTHRSASRYNNERLEFLGDAVLNLTVAQRLFEQRPDASEGDLSRARAALVKKATLADVGRGIGVDAQLVLGTGELRSGGAARSSALADAVEALIGAVLLDGGFDAASGLVSRLLDEQITTLPDSEALKDPKTKLQEWLQGRGRSLPAYTVESVSGSDHERAFSVICDVDDGGRRARGTGTSRRAAEQDAAARMLAELGEDA
jgi:ribonuclease-3